MKKTVTGLVIAMTLMAANANAMSFTDDFNDGILDGWTPKIGSWSITNDTLSNNGSVYGVIWKDDSFGVDQKIQVDAYFDFSTNTIDDELAHLRVRTNKNTNGIQPFWDTGYLADFRQNEIAVYNTYLGGNPKIASFTFNNTPFTQDGWYELAFSVEGTGSDTLFSAWVNGIQYLDQTYNNSIADLDSGYLGLGRKITYDNAKGYSYSTHIPEPSTALLFGIGAFGFVGTRLRNKKK